MNRKEFVLNAVSRKQDLVVEVSDRIFDFAETGFHEFETAKLYTTKKIRRQDVLIDEPLE